MRLPRILVVDDHVDMADGLGMLLAELPADVSVTHSGAEAMALLAKPGEAIDLVLSDIRMPAIDGVELLQRIRARWPRLDVILITAHGSIDSAVEAMKRGARDYVTKPFDNEALLQVVRRALASGTVPADPDVASIVGDIAAVKGDDLLGGLETALGILRRAIGADDCEVFLREPEGHDLLLSAWAGQDGAALVSRARFEPGVGYAGIVAVTGEPLTRAGGLGEDPRFLRPAVTERGIRSAACVPLEHPAGTLGSLHVLSRREDYPVLELIPLLQRVAVPLANRVRAGLGALRESVDAVFAHSAEATPEKCLRQLLEALRAAAGARAGTLALAGSEDGAPNPVVSTGPASLLCACGEGGEWRECAIQMGGHAFAPPGGRRDWPELCRRGLSRRVAQPGCLPLVANGRFHGLVILDLGRPAEGVASSPLVPLLTMARQAAIRLEPVHAGIPVDVGQGGDNPVADSGTLEIACLGPFRLSLRGRAIAAEAFPRSKALVLLKLLALRGGAPLNRDQLMERLWPDVSPLAGANRLHGVVHALRSVIEPHRTERRWIHLRNRGDVYYLDLGAPIDIDIVRFRRGVTEGLQAAREHPRRAIALLEEAVALYRGDLFEDDPHAEWCASERRELRERHAAALERLAELHSDQGDHELVLDCLRRALRFDALREDLHQELMQVLMRLGRRSEALAQYEDCRRLLAQELDAAPGPELQELHAELLESLQRGDSGH